MSLKFSYKLTDSNIYAHLLYRIHAEDASILDSAGIENVVEKAVQGANKVLHHRNCNILIFSDDAQTSKEEGVGGFSYVADIVNIFINPRHKKGASAVVKEHLPSVLVHELYHARRNTIFGHGKTLAGSLVAEGLALAFEKFIYPDKDIPHIHAIMPAEMEKVWLQAAKELNSEDFNYQEWFLGKGKLQKWTGYSLGYEIVRQYLEKNPKENPATLVDIDPRAVVENFQIG